MKSNWKAEGHLKDGMTPLERKKALSEGREADRVPCVPFMGEFKCHLTGISIWDYWHDAYKMAEIEILTYNRYGYDRIVIGPNSRGITEALGGRFIYPEKGLPYADEPVLKDYRQLEIMEPADADKNRRIRDFIQAADMLSEAAGVIVPIEASIGGPFTISSNLRGVERLLRDCRKAPKEIHKLMRIVTDSQKSCIDEMSKYGLGIAMADPVANPALIGPKMYEKFVYPYTKELTDYALQQTGQKVSLHMCGSTYNIWKYLCKYELNELSLDNIIDMDRAAEELGEFIPIAGNVAPVEIVMNGTKEEIEEAVWSCIAAGSKAKNGYTLATGCDIPDATKPEQIDIFMDAARNYR